MNKLKYSNKKRDICIFVYRTNSKGDKLMMAKPCKNCYNSIHYILLKKNYNLKKIYYSDNNGDIKIYD